MTFPLYRVMDWFVTTPEGEVLRAKPARSHSEGCVGTVGTKLRRTCPPCSMYTFYAPVSVVTRTASLLLCVCTPVLSCGETACPLSQVTDYFCVFFVFVDSLGFFLYVCVCVCVCARVCACVCVRVSSRFPHYCCSHSRDTTDSRRRAVRIRGRAGGEARGQEPRHRLDHRRHVHDGLSEVRPCARFVGSKMTSAKRKLAL